MAPKTTRRRSGFSLIELLIVVAIIAALVGVAVPFFQDNLGEAQVTKAGQDLDVIYQGINRYFYDKGRFLTGTSLEPLVGRYMQELPDDPWGNPYLYDGAFGMVLSYGGDALPQGTGGDADIVRRLVHAVEIIRVQYQGSWGPPNAQLDGTGTPIFVDPDKGNAFVLTMSKPYSEINAAELARHVDLLTNIDGPAGSPVRLDDAGYPAAAPANYSPPAVPWKLGTWKSVGDYPLPSWDKRHDPSQGILVLRAAETTRDASRAQSITPTMALDFEPNIDSATTIIQESYYQNMDPSSPMDPAIYGTEAYDTYKSLVRSSKLIHGQRRGVRIERY